MNALKKNALCPECGGEMENMSVTPVHDSCDKKMYALWVCRACAHTCEYETINESIWWSELGQDVKRTICSLVSQTSGIIGSVSVPGRGELKYSLTQDRKEGGYFVEWYLEVNYHGEIWQIFISDTRIETRDQKPIRPERLKITWTVHTISQKRIVATPVLFRAGVPVSMGRSQQLFYPPMYCDNMYMISDLELIYFVTGLHTMAIGTLPYELEFDTQEKIWLEKK